MGLLRRPQTTKLDTAGLLHINVVKDPLGQPSVGKWCKETDLSTTTRRLRMGQHIDYCMVVCEKNVG